MTTTALPSPNTTPTSHTPPRLFVLPITNRSPTGSRIYRDKQITATVPGPRRHPQWAAVSEADGNGASHVISGPSPEKRAKQTARNKPAHDPQEAYIRPFYVTSVRPSE